ncbi:MAG: hypothetical protein R2710_12100 [Acidimicrobiales bacterium]
MVAGKNYTYTVKAIDAAANTSWRSNTAVASTKAASTDAERPSTLKGLNGLATGGTVVLTWTSATDNVGVTGYEIYRSTDGTVGSVPRHLADLVVHRRRGRGGVAYTYTVKAFDEAGNVSWRSNLTTINS